jgi:threonine dehydratase
MEPAGALAIAGAKKWLELQQEEGQTVVAICSGANMDFDRLRFVSERADSTETLLAARISERPGAFRQLYATISPRNVTEFAYRYNNPDSADVIISFQCRPGSQRKEDKQAVIKAIRDSGEWGGCSAPLGPVRTMWSHGVRCGAVLAQEWRCRT